jgi:hypothetical protein
LDLRRGPPRIGHSRPHEPATSATGHSALRHGGNRTTGPEIAGKGALRQQPAPPPCE